MNPDLEELSARAEADFDPFTMAVIMLMMAVLFAWAFSAGCIVRSWHYLKFWLTVTRVCAWCQVVTHRAPFGTRDNVTHGMCRKCLAKEISKLQPKESNV